MITLFLKNEIDFNNNGVCLLDDICIRAKVTENLDGLFIAEFEFLMGEKYNLIECQSIIKCPTPKGDQLFRIVTIEPSTRTGIVLAEHILYDLDGNFVADINIVDKTGQQALDHILNNAYKSHRFVGFSDIATLKSARLVRKKILNEAIINSDDNSFISRWGGEVDFDNYKLSVLTKRGRDTDYTLKYGLNILGYEFNISTKDVVTIIEPRGYDGFGLDDKYVISPNYNNFEFAKYSIMKYDHVKVFDPDNADDGGFNNKADAQRELRRLAEEMFTKHNVDKPIISGTVNFLDLRRTDQYKHLTFLEELKLGDTVVLEVGYLSLRQRIRIVRYEYNPITKTYLKIDLGDIKPTILENITRVDEMIEEDDFKGGIEDSYVIARRNEIVIGDKPNVSDMKDCIIMNRQGISFSNNGYRSVDKLMALLISGKINATAIKVGTLDVNRLNGQTIDATLIEVTNIVADNIKTGSFNADLIKVGSINADLIKVGKLNADLIKTGKLSNGSVEIDMENSSSLLVKTGGVSTVISEYGIYLWKNSDLNGRVTYGSHGSVFLEGLVTSSVITASCVFDQINVADSFIQLGNTYLNFLTNGGNGMISKNQFWLGTGTFYDGSKYCIKLIDSPNYPVDVVQNALFEKNLHVNGSITSSNVPQSLSRADNRNLASTSYTTTETFVGDLGSAIIDSTGTVYCEIDYRFRSIANTDINYHIFTQVYQGAITKIERFNTHFIIYGEEGTEFSWELKAKKLRSEMDNLDNNLEMQSEISLNISNSQQEVSDTLESDTGVASSENWVEYFQGLDQGKEIEENLLGL